MQEIKCADCKGIMQENEFWLVDDKQICNNCKKYNYQRKIFCNLCKKAIDNKDPSYLIPRYIYKFDPQMNIQVPKYLDCLIVCFKCYTEKQTLWK